MQADELTIQTYIPLIQSKIKRYRNPQEYLGAAYYGLLYAIRNSEGQSDLARWISICINKYVSEEYRNKQMIRIPSSTRYDAKRRGVELKQLKQEILEDRKCYGDSRYYQEIKDSLEEASKDEIDSKIIKLRIQGYTDEEISTKLGYSIAAIHKRRIKIKARFYESLYSE